MRNLADRRNVARLCAFVMCLALAPAWAPAQSIRPSLTGVVTDSSGAVLPGVTVEAASPALIEKVRTGVTDGDGQYRILDLQPGVYTVTFTLPGFGTVKQEGLELAGSNVARVNTQMRVGDLQETVTVLGESPTVDVQTPRQTQVLNKEILSEMPLERTATAIASTLVPAMNSGLSAYGAQGTTGPETGRLQVDGVGVGSGTSGTSQYRPDTIQATELVISSFGNLGEAEVGSPIVNIIPRVGGNIVSGTFYFDGSPGGFASDNTEDLVAAGVIRAPNELIQTSQLNLGVGGPIVRDRLWYFGDGAVPDGVVLRHEHVGEQERRRPDQVDLRPGFRPPRHQRQLVWQRIGPLHVADLAAPQAERLLGRAAQVRAVLRRQFE